MRTRVVVTVLVALVLIAATVVWAAQRRTAPVPVDPDVTLQGGALLVRDTLTGHLAVVDARGDRRQTPAVCARGYTAGDRVLCLGPDPVSPTSYQLSVLDGSFTELRHLPLNGIPTRARVSADGRMLAFTVFVTGDSYLSSGFSTRTGVLDLDTDVLAGSLEDFTVDGRRPPVDANFWGVSFAADDNTFYATMSTGTHFYLVRGDFAAETLTVLDDAVECPSLSPDGTRLVYKKRMPDLSWQLWIYDLRSQRRTQLPEPRRVDDQGAWLDDATVMYGVLDDATGDVDVYALASDGESAPRLLAANAESPAVIN